AGVLLLAAAAKLASLGMLLRSGGLLSYPSLLVIAITWEVAAGLLIATSEPRVGLSAALTTYVSLSLIAGFSWWSQQDCNCFGPQTPKGLPFVVDIACVGAAGWGIFKLIRRHPPTNRLAFTLPFRSALVIACVGGSTAAAATVAQIHLDSAGESMPKWFGENLIGKPLPLLQDDRIDDAVGPKGESLWVLVRPDCNHCQDLVSHWQQRSEALSGVSIFGVSILPEDWSVMPGRVSMVSPSVGGEHCIHLRWEPENEPFVASPALIAVKDRIVVGVRTGDEVDTLLASPDWVDRIFVRER
ncbi:MAG: MauE/DoxX family redox-associated membrane protein, partial [Planctomycetota bacterium]